jgi:hypothetical protein
LGGEIPPAYIVIPAEAGIQEDAICYAVSAKGASPHRMRPSKGQFSKENYP